MATKNEILGTDPQGGNAPTPASSASGQPTNTSQSSSPQQPQSPQGGHAALYQSLNPFTPPTAEELAKEKKKQKRDQIYNAIGDGVSALANLYFTTQGAPSMYDGKRTLTGQSKIRYDKMIADRKADTQTYINGYLKARQADDANANAERSWQRQLGIDKKNDERYQESIDHRNEREKVTDDRYNAEQEYRKGRDKTTDERWQQQFTEGKRQFNQRQASEAAKLKAAADKDAAERADKQSKKYKVGFKSANGDQVAIDKDVLDGSMAEIYNNIVNDPKAKGLPTYEKPRTDADIANYVKKYWSSSPSATKFMLELSQYSTTDESKLNESSEEEVKPYQFVSLDYNQGKNRPVWDPTK